MNPKEIDELMKFILKLRDAGLTIFVAEHDMRPGIGISVIHHPLQP